MEKSGSTTTLTPQLVAAPPAGQSGSHSDRDRIAEAKESIEQAEKDLKVSRAELAFLQKAKEIRAIYDGLDTRTRFLVGFLCRYNYLDGCSAVGFINDMFNESYGQAEFLVSHMDEFEDDPQLKVLVEAVRAGEILFWAAEGGDEPDEPQEEAPMPDEITIQLGTGKPAGDYPEQDKTERCCTLDKASGEFARVVKWLLARSFSEKLAAFVASRLLTNDVESNIQEAGLYDGDVGGDIHTDWTEDVLRAAEDPQATKALDAESRFVLAYPAGIKSQG